MAYCVICNESLDPDCDAVIWTERKGQRTYSHKKCFEAEQAEIKEKKGKN